MSTPLLPHHGQLAADRLFAGLNGFAKAVRAAQSRPMAGARFQSGARSHIPTPSLTSRFGLAAGPHPRFRADRRRLADADAHRRWLADRAEGERELHFSSHRAALGSVAITTPDGGSVPTCANPRFFSPCSLVPLWPAAWKPTASAPLPAPRRVPSSPMRPTTTRSPVRRSARPAVRCATTWACATSAATETILTARPGAAARRHPTCNATGGQPPVALCVLGDHITNHVEKARNDFPRLEGRD